MWPALLPAIMPGRMLTDIGCVLCLQFYSRVSAAGELCVGAGCSAAMLAGCTRLS